MLYSTFSKFTNTILLPSTKYFYEAFSVLIIKVIFYLMFIPEVFTLYFSITLTVPLVKACSTINFSTKIYLRKRNVAMIIGLIFSKFQCVKMTQQLKAPIGMENIENFYLAILF